jgi:hypothetical protein
MLEASRLFRSHYALLSALVGILSGCPTSVHSDGGTTDGGADVSRADATGDVGATPDASQAGLGGPCTHDDQCASMVCLSIGHCSRACAGRDDCPASPNWTCVSLPGRGTICDCTPAAMTDLPCNNVDDDCNGLVDDTSRMCGATCVDVSTSNTNCGSCGIACDGRILVSQRSSQRWLNRFCMRSKVNQFTDGAAPD